MELIFDTLLFLHIASGFISLVLFWLPVIMRKGGKGHVIIGRIYVWCMWVVVITAAILSIKNLIIGRTVIGAFLGFISIITANPLWYSIAILKHKKGVSPKYRAIQGAFNGLIVLAAIALVTYGIMLQGKGAAVLMFIFGGLGLANIPNLINSLKKTQKPKSWLREHLVGMLISGIAAYTAFLVFGANNYLSEVLAGYWTVVPWIAPTVIGTVGIRMTVRYYQKRKMIPADK